MASPTNPAASARAARQANFRRSLASASGRRFSDGGDEMHFPSQNPTNHDLLLWLNEVRRANLPYFALIFMRKYIMFDDMSFIQKRNMFPSDRSSFT